MRENEVLVQEFTEEAKSHTEKIEVGLLALEKGEKTDDLVNEVFRCAHSIKGTGSFFGLHKIVELAHAMENLLGRVRNKSLDIDQTIIDALLEANDVLKHLIGHVATSNEEDISLSLSALRQFLGENTEGKALTRTLTLQESASVQMQEQRADQDSVDYSSLFKELIKKGHKVYKLCYSPKADRLPTEKAFAEMSGSIHSIGKMLLSRPYGTDIGSGAESDVLFVFSTILDKELVLIALGLDMQAIIELDIRHEEQAVIAELTSLAHSPGKAAMEKIPTRHPSLTTAGQEEEPSPPTRDEERIRVDVGLLNNLVNLSSEMILARNQLLRLLADSAGQIPGLSAVLQKINHTTTSLQENIMQTRMQPVANLFNAIPRMVRELSKSLGKEVALVVEGQEVELDRSIIEGLKDPFTHLIRNALDHGIETPKERERSGKPRTAALRIAASSGCGRVTIDITDDGAGVDVNRVRQKALEKGLVDPEKATSMSENEVLRLVFLPGFSTSEQISSVSGRGVGLDVVKANVEKLGGTVEVYTERRAGTTFRLVLPLTLAIIPSLLVESSGHGFALPQAGLLKILRLVPGEIHKFEEIQGQRVLRLKNTLLPVVMLSEAVGLPPAAVKDRANIPRLLVLQTGTQNFGLVVDKINDREDILVKPLPGYLETKQVYSGVTILGDGKIAMVLDTKGLANTIHRAEEQVADETGTVEKGLSEDVKTKVMLFMASGSETFGLCMAEVARVVPINPQEIEHIGGKEYYYFQGNILRLLHLEQYLPLKPQQPVDRTYLIIPKVNGVKFALVAAKIKDTVETVLHFLPSAFSARGLAGSLLVEGKVVLLLSLPELFTLVEETELAGRRENGQ